MHSRISQWGYEQERFEPSQNNEKLYNSFSSTITRMIKSAWIKLAVHVAWMKFGEVHEKFWQENLTKRTTENTGVD
jgi:hypothetical protein